MTDLPQNRRKTTLVECSPHWVIYTGREGDSPDAIYFECPEGHEDCKHIIPFSPALDGRKIVPGQGPIWQRKGDTFENLSLSPSIRRIQRYPDKETALKDGCKEEYITESLFCAFHGFIDNGKILFCGDSK